MQELKINQTKKIFLRNGTIIFSSTLGACILFSPARHFGETAIAFIVNGSPTAPYATGFGIFCGISSVAATAVLGFNAWDKILSLPDSRLKALLKRLMFYIGGISTVIPLMIDNFTLNQYRMDTAPNLIVTVLPGIFMSGVYGQAIEFVFNEFSGRNNNQDSLTSAEDEHLHKRIALGVGTILGSIAAIGSYWETLNILNPVINSSITSNILSAFPVVCRAPLFIKSTFNVTNKSLTAVSNCQKPSCSRLSLLLLALVFSVFTIGGYSDIAYNGMTQSSTYENSSLFRQYIYPTTLGIVMLCMWLLNADALVVAGEKANKYFSERGFNRYLIFKRNYPQLTETTPLIQEAQQQDEDVNMVIKNRI